MLSKIKDVDRQNRNKGNTKSSFRAENDIFLPLAAILTVVQDRTMIDRIDMYASMILSEIKTQRLQCVPYTLGYQTFLHGLGVQEVTSSN